MKKSGKMRVDAEKASLRLPSADAKCWGYRTRAFGEEESVPFAFMAKVPTVWKNTVGLAGTPDTMFVAARETRDGAWYVGGITIAEARDCTLDTSFLAAGEWTIEIFRDAGDAKEDAQRYVHETRKVSLLRGDVGYGSDAVMCEAESRGITYLFKIRRSTHVRRLFKSLADGAGWSDCGFGWQAIEVSLRLDGWARGRRVLFIRRPAEKKVEAAEPKRRRRKMTPSPKDGVVVPTVPGRLKQGESEFVKDFKGREWDYCALVTNDANMDVWPSPLGEFGCGYFRSSLF